MALIHSKQLNPRLTGSFTVSGSITGDSESTGSFGRLEVSSGKVSGDLQVNDDLIVGEYISHKDDANTRINFTSDRIQLEAGGINFFGAHKKDSSPHLFTINNGSNNIDFQIKDNSNNILFRTDADQQLVKFPDAIMISGSSTSTGSFGKLLGDASELTNLPASFTANEISGAFTDDSASFSTRITTEETNVDTLQARNINTGTGLSGGGNLTSDRTLVVDFSDSTLQANISGAFTTDSASFATRLDSRETFTTESFSDGTATIISGSSTSTGSFGVLKLDGGQFTSASIAGGASYDGNRRILNTNFPTLFSASFNPGTSGSVSDFLDSVFYPNTPPNVSSSQFTINEFEVSGSSVGTITTTDAEHFSYELSFATQSGYTDDFFAIHSGSGAITLNTMSSASFNTDIGNHASGNSHPFLVQVTDGILTSTATIYIRVTPNTAPNFRTTSVSGTIISNNTGSVNENTTDGTTVLTMFITDEEDDTITISPLSQSSGNEFSMATSNVGGGKRIVITTNTGSFDFETTEQYTLEVSASDQHYNSSEPSASGYLTTLPFIVNVTNNQAPTMASQVFSCAEDSGSRDDNGLGANSNSLTTIGTITTNDNEGDTVTFTSLTLTSGSGGGNGSQSDPSNNPFQVTSAGVIQLKAGQFLNFSKFSQYKYDATYKDNFNAASSSGTITINITQDDTPSLTSNVTGNSFHIIESATSGSSVRRGTNGRTGTVADFDSNESVVFSVVPSGSATNKDTGSFGIDSSGNLSIMFDASGSEYNFNSGNVLSGSVTVTNAFGTTNTSAFAVSMSINNAPTPSFSNTSANLNTNGARLGNTLTTISFSDDESDTLDHSTFVFTDPSGKLVASRENNTYIVSASENLSGSDFVMTASIKDNHGFRTNPVSQSITIAHAPKGTLTSSSLFYVIESAVSGANIVTNSNGRTGTQADFGVTYTPQFNSAAVQDFKIFESNNSDLHQFITSSAAGGLSLKANVSASGILQGSTITGSARFEDQFGNIGSGSFSVNVAINNSPSITLSVASASLPTEDIVSGSFISSASFSDTESDTINFDSFQILGQDGSNFTATRSGNAMVIEANTDLSASKYDYTVHVQDEHGFRTGSASGHVNVTPMIYFYKQSAGVQIMDASNAINKLGDPGADDVSVISGSLIDQFKSGSIGDSLIITVDDSNNPATASLVASQSNNFLAQSGSTSIWRQFGNIDMSGNSDNGHSWVCVFPSQSAMEQKPNSMRGSLGGSTAEEFTVFNDNSVLDAAESSDVHYFSTHAGVKIRGVDRFGIVHGVGANTATTQFYHLIPSSGSSPSSEV